MVVNNGLYINGRILIFLSCIEYIIIGIILVSILFKIEYLWIFGLCVGFLVIIILIFFFIRSYYKKGKKFFFKE